MASEVGFVYAAEIVNFKELQVAALREIKRRAKIPGLARLDAIIQRAGLGRGVATGRDHQTFRSHDEAVLFALELERRGDRSRVVAMNGSWHVSVR